MDETGSFLQEELDAFDKIYAELLNSPYQRTNCVRFAQDGSSEPEAENLEIKTETKSGAIKSEDTEASVDPDSDMELHFAAKFDRIRIRDDDASIFKIPPERTSRSPSQDKLANIRKCASHDIPSSADKFWGETPGEVPQIRRRTKSCFSDNTGSFRSSTQYDTSDKLFLDLLDDLDSISGNTPSAKRRKKARDMFSEWLFHQDKSLKTKNRKSFTEYTQKATGMGIAKSWLLSESDSKSKQNVSDQPYAPKGDDDIKFIDENDEFFDARETLEPAELMLTSRLTLADCQSEVCLAFINYCSNVMIDVFSLTDCAYTCHHKCRQSVALDCASVASPDSKNGEKSVRKNETSLVEGSAKAVRFLNKIKNNYFSVIGINIVTF